MISSDRTYRDFFAAYSVLSYTQNIVQKSWGAFMFQLRSPVVNLPTMYDLPSEDPEEMGLPSAKGVSLEVSSSACPARDEFHGFQPQLLTETCLPPAVADYFVAADLNLYYDVDHTLWHKRPDWFLVLGVPASRSQEELRWSYVLWQEGAAPFLIVELLSPGTEEEDLGQTLQVVGKPPTKWHVYEQMLQVPYYAIYDRTTNHFRLFQHQENRYQEVVVNEDGFWFEMLDLGLRVWEGVYQGVSGRWLRWFDRQGNWIPTQVERTEQEVQRAEAAQERADRLANKLRELGIDPETLE